MQTCFCQKQEVHERKRKFSNLNMINCTFFGKKNYDKLLGPRRNSWKLVSAVNKWGK